MSNKQTQTTERHFDIVQHIDTGRLFLAEFSAASGEWYELGTGRTYPMCGVRLIGQVAGELVKEAEKKATEWAHRGLDNEGCNITQDEVENTLCEYFSRGFDAARNMITAEIAEMARRLVVENVKDTILYGHGSVTKEDVRSGLEKICAGKGVQEAAKAADQPVPADLEAEIKRWWDERYAKLKKDYKFDSMSGHYLTNEGFIDFARHIVTWHSKRVAAYIRECLEPEENLLTTIEEAPVEIQELSDDKGKNYTRGKIRGYKDILRDLESGGLDEYLEKTDKN